MNKTNNIKDKSFFPKGRSWIEIDKGRLKKNIAEFERILPKGCQLMPVVKANAYGHGAVSIANELNRLGIKSFCVATVQEGVELRKNGICGDILVLGYTHSKLFYLLCEYHLIQTVFDHAYAELLNAYGKKIEVHLKIDTGMHRLGICPEAINEIFDIYIMKNLIITGIYTHLCAAETLSEKDAAYTKKQEILFYEVISELIKRGHACGSKHILASYGLLNYPDLGGEYARVGIALYGLLSEKDHVKDCPVSLSPVLSLKTRIVQVRNIYAGESVGYGLLYTADSDKTIAVLAVGYADGVPRALSCGKGNVLINGKQAPVIGRVCMDQMMVDITDIPNVRVGGVATVIGRDGEEEITVYQLAELCGTNPHEVCCHFSERLERILV